MVCVSSQKKIISAIIQVPVLLEPKSNHSLNSNPIHLFGNICTLLFYIIFSLTSFGSVWAIIRQLQFKGLYKVYEYTFSLKSVHHVYQNPLLDPCLNHPFQYKPYVYTLSLRPCLILLSVTFPVFQNILLPWNFLVSIPWSP